MARPLRKTLTRNTLNHTENALVDAIHDDCCIENEPGSATRTSLRQVFDEEFPHQFAPCADFLCALLTYGEMRMLLRCIREHGKARDSIASASVRLQLASLPMLRCR